MSGSSSRCNNVSCPIYGMAPAMFKGVHSNLAGIPEGCPHASMAVPGPQAPAQALDFVLFQQPLSS